MTDTTARLKCNREKPCQNCSARNEQTNCEFRGPKNAVSAVHRGSHGDGMHQRIDHLEDMVKKLIADREQASQPSVSSASASESPVSGPASALAVASCGPENSTVCPKTMIDGAHSVYVGGQDWYSVLQEVPQEFPFLIRFPSQLPMPLPMPLPIAGFCHLFPLGASLTIFFSDKRIEEDLGSRAGA